MDHWPIVIHARQLLTKKYTIARILIITLLSSNTHIVVNRSLIYKYIVWTYDPINDVTH